MKKVIATLIFVIIMTLIISANVFAQDGDPVGGCPDGFHIHNIMDHDNHLGHMHQHVGSAADQNGDGYLCVKHASVEGGIHVHIDNNVPLY